MPKLFKDQAIEDEILEKGYLKVTLLPPDAVKMLVDETNKFIKTLPKEYMSGFLSLGRVTESDLRYQSTTIIRKLFIPYLYNYLMEDEVEIMSGVHLIKVPGMNGELSIHQDSSMIDEHEFLSAYAWTPLQKTHRWNGTLKIIPGSHLLGNTQRSLNVFNPFAEYTPALKKYEIALSVKPGEVVFFHSALMHASSTNLTLSRRVAINCFIKPKKAQLTHYYRDENTPVDKVERFAVPADFYFKEDILKRPDESKYPMYGMEKWDLPSLTPSQFKELCQQFLENHLVKQ